MKAPVIQTGQLPDPHWAIRDWVVVGQDRTLASLDEKPDDLKALKDMNQAENNRRTTSVILLCVIPYV